MDLDRDSSGTDEYFVTALQIFDYCGGESSGSLRVDTLMDKFAPFIKTEKGEFNYLKSLLDPEQCNPEVSVTRLARALHQYSDAQNSKVDLDESFNLKPGQMPQDSDSGISTDAGYQLLEELQCELREKVHLANQLRGQLDFTDRQHEEALATLTAERDSLKTHLNILREENISLGSARRDYEEASERLVVAERALVDARRDLEAIKRRVASADERVAAVAAENQNLQELLVQSKAECHRMNEMYQSRQAGLRARHEALRAERAELAARVHDQDTFLQQLVQEKVFLEMELKDVLGRSTQSSGRLERSFDVSYSEDALVALDPLTAESRFSQENQILDEEDFVKALKEDQGRSTNMSLFDEIRLSFCNISRHNDAEKTQWAPIDNVERSFITTATQTGCDCKDNNNDIDDVDCLKCENNNDKHKEINNVSVAIQTVDTGPDKAYSATQTDFTIEENKENACPKTQKINTPKTNNRQNKSEIQKCTECEKLKKLSINLENDLNTSQMTVKQLSNDLVKYDDNLTALQHFLDDGKERNNILETVVKSLQTKLGRLEQACEKQRACIDSLTPQTNCGGSQTECDITSVSTQADVPCADCATRTTVAPPKGLRKYLWEPLKSLFQLFAALCFVCALWLLCGVSRRWTARCAQSSVPWRWIDAQEIMDFLLRIEYVADVPM